MSPPAVALADVRSWERSSFADEGEIDAFVEMLRRFEQKEIDAEQWRSFRAARGAYSQRQDSAHMLRVKVPQGVVSAEQMRALAEVGERFSRSIGHVTTRQDIQFHDMRQEDLAPAMRALARAGMTTVGAGGNTVRNVVACPLAGVAPDEAFDVTPYAEATSRHFLRHPLAGSLPRKLKIAFEGCAHDHVATPLNDLGFRARVRTEGGRVRRGFGVTIAGGTSSLPTSGAVLFEFLPASDVLALAEAVVRLFHARGDRANKSKSRLKFLVRELGLEPFRAALEQELADVRAEGQARLPFDPDFGPAEPPPEPRAKAPPPTPNADGARSAPPDETGPALAAAGDPPPSLESFLRTNVRRQRQSGYSVVSVAAPQGKLTSAQMRALADLSRAHGEGGLRLASGHALLRGVPDQDVPTLFSALAAAGLGREGAGSACDVVSCPGAEVCRLAITRSRDVARAIEQRIRSSLGASARETPLAIHVSGCPSGCSLHHAAAIGLQGSVRKQDGRAVPHYLVLLGGGFDDRGARFAQAAGRVPAQRAPEAVERLVALFLAERRAGEAAGDFFAREIERARALLAAFEAQPDSDRPERGAEPAAPVDEPSGRGPDRRPRGLHHPECPP